jgi:hypothetical protein
VRTRVRPVPSVVRSSPHAVPQLPTAAAKPHKA